MGKIVKLKNKKTGVRVYPVTATSAVVDANSGERLNDTLQNKVEEAPVDGNQYVRSGGTWKVAELASAGIERCNISLVSNQGVGDAASLNGATVKVTNADTSEVYYNDVWDGNEISLEFTPGVNYKVEVGNVADYATPEAKIFTALEQNVRNAVMTYQTELVSVTLSSDDNTSLIGQSVTINGKSHTWNGVAISQKIAFGVNYSVVVNSKTGYTTPLSQEFTASQNVRNLSMVYYKKLGTLTPTEGIYIQSTEGYYLTIDEWNKSVGLEPNGVAVLTENCSFVISLNEIVPNYAKWSVSKTLVDNITTTTTESEAIVDYDGVNQTTQIINQLGDESSAAYKCSQYVFPNGKNGYLGSAGEWKAVLDNSSQINSALNACGGESLGGYNWTSTQYSETSAWMYVAISNSMPYILKDDHDSFNATRAFSTLN